MLTVLTASRVSGGEEATVDRSSPQFDVPYYTGTVYPPPKSARYGDAFLPLGRTGVVLGKGIVRNDARVALLAERIERFGGSVDVLESPDSPCETLVLIGDTGVQEPLLEGKTVPDKPEGYLLHSVPSADRAVAFLKGQDFHGLLWAVTAFNQLVTEKKGRPVARAATIRDYPETPGVRGYTPFYDDENTSKAWFAVNVLRANVVQYRHVRRLYRRMEKRPERDHWRAALRDEKVYGEWLDQVRKIGAFLNPLRITWYDGMQPISSIREDNMRSKSEEDFQLVSRVGMDLASAGGNLMILYDDVRFPVSEQDEQNFGTAREADVHFLNRVYAAVAAKYPDFRILFCPPFYWGPASNPGTAYGEPRQEYLAAIGERLPKAVEIFWTGPRVKSGIVTKEDTEWIRNLIQRKPVYWQNTCGTYHGSLYYAYPPEPMNAWKNWYYDGFFSDLAFYTYNGEDPYITLTLHDAMWNGRAYDPAASGVEAAKKLVGIDAYPKLVEAFKALEAMDEYGWFKPTAFAARNVEQVRKGTEQLVKLLEAAPAPLKSPWVKLKPFVQYRERYLKNLLRNPDLKAMTEIDEQVRALAAKETGMDPEQACVTLTPNDFRAGRSPTYYAWKTAERRYVLWINGARSKAPHMQAQFQLPYPLTGHSELIISALDHNAEPPCRIRILVNDNVVFEGENSFEQQKWTRHTFQVKGAFLRDGVMNTVRIENLVDSDLMIGAPWFMLNYLVLKPEK